MGPPEELELEELLDEDDVLEELLLEVELELELDVELLDELELELEEDVPGFSPPQATRVVEIMIELNRRSELATRNSSVNIENTPRLFF